MCSNLVLQRDYRPSGWLGIMLGTMLYYDMSAVGVTSGLVEKIGDHIKSINNKGAVPVKSLPSTPRALSVESKPSLASMSVADVARWAETAPGVGAAVAERLAEQLMDGAAMQCIAAGANSPSGLVAVAGTLREALAIKLGPALALARAVCELL